MTAEEPEIVLETDRLRLRLLEAGDLDRVAGLFADPRVMRYYPAVRTRDESQAWLDQMVERYRVEGHGLWLVERRDDGRFIGLVGLVRQEVAGRQEIELGYLLATDHWHQGYASEAGAACLIVARLQLGARRVVSLIDPRNEASRRVAQRLGMRPIGRVIKWNKPLLVYALDLEPKADERRRGARGRVDRQSDAASAAPRPGRTGDTPRGRHTRGRQLNRGAERPPELPQAPADKGRRRGSKRGRR